MFLPTIDRNDIKALIDKLLNRSSPMLFDPGEAVPGGDSNPKDSGIALPPPSSTDNIDWEVEPKASPPDYVSILTGMNNVNESMRVPLDLPIVGVRTLAQNALVLYTAQANRRLVVRIRNLLVDAQFKVGLQLLTPEAMEIVKRHQVRAAAHSTESLTEAATQFAAWVRAAMRQGAIDMHLECRSEEQGSVLMRVHGELEPIVTGIDSETVLTCIKAAY